MTRNSSVTVDVNGQSKTFKHGDHVTFAANSGGKQTLTFDGAEFVGYGQPADYQGRDVKDKLVSGCRTSRRRPRRRGGGRGGARRNGDRRLVARRRRSASRRRRSPTAAEQALAQAQAALQKATEAVQQAQTQLQGRGGRGGRRRRSARPRGAAAG